MATNHTFSPDWPDDEPLETFRDLNDDITTNDEMYDAVQYLLARLTAREREIAGLKKTLLARANEYARGKMTDMDGRALYFAIIDALSDPALLSPHPPAVESKPRIACPEWPDLVGPRMGYGPDTKPPNAGIVGRPRGARRKEHGEGNWMSKDLEVGHGSSRALSPEELPPEEQMARELSKLEKDYEDHIRAKVIAEFHHYIRHIPDCGVFDGFGAIEGQCTCGLDALLGKETPFKPTPPEAPKEEKS